MLEFVQHAKAKIMKPFAAFYFVIILALLSCPAWGQASAPTVETLVCFRHGEKPPDGLGQLDCQGLNRALALPKVLLSKYGKPQFIFAPNPSQKEINESGSYYYVRPFVTVEPTAIRCGMPVQLPFGYKETKALQAELLKSKYDSATIFVAWEHENLQVFVKRLMTTLGGDVSQVPHWRANDFDSIFVVRITRGAGHIEVSFAHDYENLNNQSTAYP